MKNALISLFFLSVLLVGCSNHHTANTPLKENDIRETHGSIENIDRLNQFVNKVKRNQDDKVRLIRYTTEGDPIFHDLNYDGTKLAFTLDSREDQYGGGMEKYDCQGIDKIESSTETKYLLTGCSKPEVSELLTISYDVDKEDLFAFRLKYGKEMSNVIDTKEQKIEQQNVNGKTEVLNDFQFSREEMNKIYKSFVFANYLDEKSLSTKCQKQDSQTFDLTVWINSAEKHYKWTNCDTSMDGKQMTKLVDKILDVLRNNHNFQSMNSTE